MEPINPTAAALAAKKARHRAMNWKNTFIGFMALAVAGAALIGYGASTTTTSYGIYGSTESHDAATGAVVFIVSLISALFVLLPMLGFAHVLEAQADVLEL